MQESDLPFGKNLPDRLEKNESPEDIGLHKCTGIFNRPVHMRFGCEVNDGLYPFADYFFYSRGVRNVPSDEMITGRMRKIGEVF
jgi:hypothetical protein